MRRLRIVAAGRATRLAVRSCSAGSLVARSLATLGILAAVVGTAGCPKQREMAERVEMPDSMPVVRAMHDAGARDSMLDTIPGGEMARGDSAAEMKTLKTKM